MKNAFLAVFMLIINGLAMPLHAQTSSKYALPTLFNNDADDFIVIAHRGASAYYPENTMAAFKGAVEMNAEMIELDVLLSKDGVPVVIHDAKLNRTTNGSGLVANYTVKELKKMDAGAWFDGKFVGETLPTLAEVLAFAEGTIALNIEIKTEAVSDKMSSGVEEKSIELVKKYGMEDHVLFSSFDYRAISHLKQLDSAMPAALLYEKRQSGNKQPAALVAEYKADAFNCSYRQLSNFWVKNLDAKNIPIFIYTVDEPKRMKKLIERGVNGIFTNKPDVLLNVMREKEEH